MPTRWTDAEFEIVSGRRIGDPHPERPRLRFAGIDAHGRPKWRRAPMPFPQALLALSLAFMAFRAAVYLIAEALAHH